MKHIAVLTSSRHLHVGGHPRLPRPDGVWTKHPEQMSVYDIDSFLSDKEKSANTPGAGEGITGMERAARSRAQALVKLEKAGMLTLLATQNFDALHEKAGNSPDVIVNLHGTIGTSHCMKCHAKYDTADIIAPGRRAKPHCHRTLPYSGGMPCNGLIKTDVVYFGEPLAGRRNGEIPISWPRARTSCGSSARRWKYIRRRASCPWPHEAGVPITIMNMGRTQCDRLASRRDDIAVALPKLVDETISAA